MKRLKDITLTFFCRGKGRMSNNPLYLLKEIALRGKAKHEILADDKSKDLIFPGNLRWPRNLVTDVKSKRTGQPYTLGTLWYFGANFVGQGSEKVDQGW